MNFNRITLEISAGRADQLLPQTLPEIAFAGKSNVGKSSMINVLTGRKALARVSSTPGKTVTINFYNIDNTCRFVDLPGYGYAKVSKAELHAWSPVVDRYFTSGRTISLLVQLLDMRHEVTQNDRDMLAFIREMQLPHILVLTKQDKLNKTESSTMLEYFQTNWSSPLTRAIIPFSAKSRLGAPEILREIYRAMEE